MNPNDPARPNVDVTRGLLVAGVAVGATLVLLVVKWFLTSLFGVAGVVLVLVIVTAAGVYFWFRSQNPQQAVTLEARVKQAARNVVTQVSTRQAAAPQQPVPPQLHTVPQYGAAPYGTIQPSPSTGADGLISASLLLPSLLAYGLVYGSVSFDSPWEPWWILNGLNAFFILCVVGRARSASRRTAALLPGLSGLVLVGLATSPSPDVSLTSMFASKRWVGGYSYTEVPQDLLPWLYRAPYLAILLFVIAWGIARREGNWAAGLIPAGLMLWWSIWYRENAFTGEAGWIGLWGLSIGVFIGGCVACWAVDSLTRRPTAPSPNSWPN